MPKSLNKKKRTKKKDLKTYSTSGNKKKQNVFKRFYNVWSFVFGIIGPIALVYSFYPTVSITPSSSLDKLNPFSAPFIIKNQSAFSVKDLQISYKLKKVNLVFGKGKGNFNDSTLSFSGIDNIKPKKSITKFLALNRIIGTPNPPKIKFARIDLILKYRYLFIPFKEKFSYKSFQSPDNIVTWLPE